jgi:hypothetical protein
VEFPNVDHGFQTAEGIRAAGYPEWMILVGLVHDVGKMQFLWGGKEEGMEGTPTGHQWSLGGDTWVVGCAIPESVVFPEFNKLNPDMNDARYNTEHGIYEPGCGIRNLKIAWGHDEYAYMVVKNHTDKMRAKGAKEEDLIPEEGLYPLPQLLSVAQQGRVRVGVRAGRRGDQGGRAALQPLRPLHEGRAEAGHTEALAILPDAHRSVPTGQDLVVKSASGSFGARLSHCDDESCRVLKSRSSHATPKHKSREGDGTRRIARPRFNLAILPPFHLPPPRIRESRPPAGEIRLIDPDQTF